MSDPAPRGWHPPPLAVVADAAPAAAPPVDSEARAAAQKEGREAGYREGYAEGFAEGRIKADALARQLKALLDALAAPFAESDAVLLRESLDLTRRVAAAVLRRELQLDPAAIEVVLRDALAVLGDARGDVELTLHPADAALCRQLGVSLDASIRVRESAAVGRGGLTLRSGSELIDATVDARLQAVIAALYTRAGLPEPERPPTADALPAVARDASPPAGETLRAGSDAVAPASADQAAPPSHD